MQMNCESRKIGDRKRLQREHMQQAFKAFSRVNAERGLVRDRKVSCERVEVSARENGVKAER